MANKETELQLDYQFDNFCSNLMPFGSLDIRTAVRAAVQVGEDGDWAAECVRDFAESCDMKIDECDPVYCVYDAILQEARNEIDNLISFDFCNDGAEIYTAGNYCATSYDYSDDANDTIKEKLIENEIDFADLSEKTKWFLNEIEANY
jgi:hypothetical protein